MIITFNKYQGTGNDFIIIDNRPEIFNPENHELISNLCRRRFGIGADGLILINKHPDYDFRMRYFNADGFESTMCGNGGRCAADFAFRNGIAGKTQRFLASDGPHQAVIEDENVMLRMNDVKNIRTINGNHFIDTGSPHYVIFTKNADTVDVFEEGRKIRWSKDFEPQGTNVNFVELHRSSIYVRTYERGVEDETLSCGTGVTASAISAVLSGHFVSSPVNVRTRGGNLNVDFRVDGDIISDIWLSGPAVCVFEGRIRV
ncbi:MAG: diaminopimelate epimerase [Bacteroidales bacterium]|nr:diaminopimelate epimerase [Bacteroidales bacterium]